MAYLVHKGYFEALRDGLLDGTPDVRCKLVMSATTCETEATAHKLADFTTIDEFDGVGYSEIDCASVTHAYDAGSGELRIDCADGTFGAAVAPGSDVIFGMLIYLYVDGTAANDIALAFTNEGAGFGANASGNAVNLTVGASGLVYAKQGN